MFKYVKKPLKEKEALKKLKMEKRAKKNELTLKEIAYKGNNVPEDTIKFFFDSRIKSGLGIPSIGALSRSQLYFLQHIEFNPRTKSFWTNEEMETLGRMMIEHRINGRLRKLEK